MQTKANIALVNLEGDLDVSSVARVRGTIDSLIDGGCRRIVMNMAAADYADSAGMGLIFSELRRMRQVGGLLSLTNVSPTVYKALCLMRMIDYVPISRVGTKREVRELDPSVLPRWRTTFRVDATQMAAARARLEELLDRLPLAENDVFDMKLASGEAVGNAVDHTCEGGVLVTVAAYDDRVVVEVADCGCGFSLAADEEPSEVGEFAERGRGIKLMRLLADSVTIEPKIAGQGTVVRLVKLFSA